MRMGLDQRSITSLFLFFVILAALLFWFFTRPTPQEKSLTAFFDNVRRGNANEASEYLVESNYGKFLLDSKITDSDGFDLKTGIENDVAYLEEIAWSYIPAVKGHVFYFKPELLQTQKSETDPNIAFVNFGYAFRIKEVLDEPSIPGTVDGTMEMRRVNNKWLVKRGDFKFEMEGIVLHKYWEY